MNDRKYEIDLVILTADKDMDCSMKGILERPESLGIKNINTEFYHHPQKDPECLLDGHNVLRPFVNNSHHALIVYDKDGCGKEKLPREVLEIEIEEHLKTSGWGDRAAAIVIEPELENWLWSDSPEVDAAIGWKGKSPSIRIWLKDRGYFPDDSIKPFPPKDALEDALREARKPWSSSIFYQIAKSTTLKRCQDPAFLKLKKKLIKWFATH